MLLFFITVLLSSLSFRVLAQNPLLSLSYDNGPVFLSDTTTLYYQVNISQDLIRFGTVFNASDVLATNSSVWVGLGIGEPSSGSMLGADIVTADFENGNFSSCSITDRYVPFVAYPLTEAPGPFPFPDDCEDSDWKLLNCQRNPSTGVVVFEVERPLTAADFSQDRSIPPGQNAILHAYGSAFVYHGPRRKSTAIRLYEEEGVVVNDELPNDVDGFIDVFSTNYTIPSRRTTYACTSMALMPEDSQELRTVVAIDPMIEERSSRYVHHITVYLCSDEEYMDSTKATVACDGEDPPYGPLGNTMAKCSTFIFGCKFSFLFLLQFSVSRIFSNINKKHCS